MTNRRRPQFDPELVDTIVELETKLAPGAVTLDSIPTLRAGAGVILTATDAELSRDGAFDVEHTMVDRRAEDEDTAPVKLLVCRRAGGAKGILYYIHGGGMVAGDARNGIEELLDWAEELELSVVSVDYRLAPEHPHPAPITDCYAGLEWVEAQATELGSGQGRIIVVGASAGGGLAAATALMARDRGGPRIHALMLIAPMLDDRNDTESAMQFEGVGVWDRNSNATGWLALLGDERGQDGVSPYAAPARATDLAGLPPMHIDVGSAETFRDEAVTFAQRVWHSGGAAELQVWSGAFHGFTAYAPQTAIAQQALAARRDWIARQLD